MNPKMTILFIGKKSRTTRHQLLPIYLRVTIEGKRFEVATHRHVEPADKSDFISCMQGTYKELAILLNFLTQNFQQTRVPIM
jgi:hypothetical protein